MSLSIGSEEERLHPSDRKCGSTDGALPFKANGNASETLQRKDFGDQHCVFYRSLNNSLQIS